jgi:hypothetical protein
VGIEDPLDLLEDLAEGLERPGCEGGRPTSQRTQTAAAPG